MNAEFLRAFLNRIVAVVLVAAAALCVWRFGWRVEAGWAFVLFAALTVAAAIDQRIGLLPDIIVLPLLWLGLLLNAQGLFASASAAIWGAALGYGLLWLVAQGFLRARGYEGLGLGDCKLLAALGAWLGVSAVPYVMLAAAVAGVLAVGVRISLGRARVEDSLPFGPYLAAAGAAWLLIRW